VAREEQLHRSSGPNRQMQVAAMRQLNRLPGRIHGLNAGRLEQLQLARQPGESVAKQPRHRGKARQVARTAVDRRPGQHLVEHWLVLRSLDRGLFG